MKHNVANYSAYAKEHPVGTPVRGRVLAIAPFGIFVELTPNVQGLLEIPYFASIPDASKFPNGYPQVGVTVDAMIKFLDAGSMNIRLMQQPAGFESDAVR